MKKYITILAVALFAMFATAQTNQYFYNKGNLMFGVGISQIDSMIFGNITGLDTLAINLRTFSYNLIHDTIYSTIHDTITITDCEPNSLDNHNNPPQINQIPQINNGKWQNLKDLYNASQNFSELRKYKFSKMRLTFNKSSSIINCYSVIKYADTNKPALEFSFGNFGYYWINHINTGKRIKDVGTLVSGKTYEYDLNELCGTTDILFYVSSWQENFIPEQVEIIVEEEQEEITEPINFDILYLYVPLKTVMTIRDTTYIYTHDTTYVYDCPKHKDGAIDGEFSISPSIKVRFAQGNLQYQATTKTWRFAENQYDIVGDAEIGDVYENGVKCNNYLIGETYTGWIDLFGWGTGNKPTQYELDANYNTFVDWGMNNISNTTDKTIWRTPTANDFKYILYGRDNASSLFGLCNVNEHFGLVLLPDNWSAGAINSSYSIEEWETMEQLGAVFLPAGDSRIAQGLDKWSVGGYYWTSTTISETYVASALRIWRKSTPHVDINNQDIRSYGRFVRLISETEISNDCPSSYAKIENDTIYDGEVKEWRGLQLSETGTYIDSLKNMFGCDSILILNLVVKTGSVIDTAHCIDYLNLCGQNVTCYYGDFTNPFLNRKVIDNGYSDKTSHHTIHFIDGETDPRTGGALRTKPEGALASVRLGNWETQKINESGEGIMYEIVHKPGINVVINVNYAVVLQDAGHEAYLQPRFTLELLDKYGNRVDPTNGVVDFIADKNRPGWHTYVDYSDPEMSPAVAEMYSVTWKDWSTIALNLTDMPDTVYVRLSTRDCGLGEHYGYAYFTLDCSDGIVPGDESSLPEGALPGEFFVSPTKKVRFSKGNLQYNAALGTHQCADGTTQQGTWRFAENQWDYVGNAATYGTVYENGVKCNNALISSTYNGWIDLFGWGTSGWNSGANAYQPWNTSTSYTDYYAGGSYSNSIVGIYANADWGIYNAITNGGNKANKWRTMTHDEWCWVLNSRPNAYNLRGQATVNNVHGYILLPDNFEVPAEISFIACPDNWTSNVYSPEQWAQLDSMGAIFLPTTGYREGKNLDRFTAMCDYWSSTSDDEDSSKYVTFAGTFVKTHTWDYRYRGRGVRLVQDVE